jgi:single-strand DNA-binding protein
MAGVNKVILLGNLGQDPEVRSAKNGNKIVNLSIATSESWNDKNSGERKTKTEWHRVVIFNENIAKIAEQYLKKGSKVYLEGSIQTRKWTDQQGVEKYSTEIILQGFQAQLVLLDGKEGGGNRPPPADDPSEYGRESSRPSSGGSSSGGGLDDDIPF